MKCTAILLILATSTFSFDAAAASPTSDEATITQASVELAIEVDPTVPNASNVSRRLNSSGRSALTGVESSYEVGDRVLVNVTGEQYDYRIRVAAVRRDVALEELTDTCECNTSELTERVSVAITRVAARFSQIQDEASPTASVEPVTPPKATEPTKPAESKAQPREPVLLPAKPQPSTRVSTPPEPLGRTLEPAVARHDARRMRVAGIATLIAGSTLLLAGAGMMAAGSTELVYRWPHYERDWRPLGFTLGGAGLAGIGVGGSLMIFEELRCRRRPDSCTPGRRYATRLDLE